MATGVLYPTTEHISGEFSTGVHERADGQDVDPVAIRREQLLAELDALGAPAQAEPAETDEEKIARLQAELADTGHGEQIPGA